MVLLKSGPHPEAYVYKHFLTRIAPAEYKSSAPEDYARHFTVMTLTNYRLLGAFPFRPYRSSLTGLLQR